MPLTTIRSFMHAGQSYRHVMCFDTDAVFLQRYQDNEHATCEDDLWLTLLKYDYSAIAYDAGGRRIGSFRTEGGSDQWVFYERPNQTRIAFEPTRGPEALLDTEVQYSKRWLEQQRLEKYNGALAAANHIQAQIDAMEAQQDELLKEPAVWLAEKINACDSPEVMGEISAHIDSWPRGYHRSEIRTVWSKRAQTVGVRWPQPAESSPAASGPATLPPAAAVASDTCSQ